MLDLKRIRHAGDRMRASDGDAEADVEMMPFVGAVEVLRGHELLARREQEGAHVGLVPDVVMGEELAEPVEALEPEIAGPRRGWRPSIRRTPRGSARRRGGPVVGRRDIGESGAAGERRRRKSSRA